MGGIEEGRGREGGGRREGRKGARECNLFFHIGMHVRLGAG